MPILPTKTTFFEQCHQCLLSAADVCPVALFAARTVEDGPLVERFKRIFIHNGACNMAQACADALAQKDAETCQQMKLW